jgi:hypothetical protein
VDRAHRVLQALAILHAVDSISALAGDPSLPGRDFDRLTPAQLAKLVGVAEDAFSLRFSESPR